MIHKIYFFTFAIAIILLSGNFQQILACSCLSERPVCEAFGDAKTVFVGEVIEGKSAEKLSDAIQQTGRSPFVFKVKQSFLGTDVDKEIQIHTGSGFGDCGFPFQKGETYLIYAYRNKNGTLETSICTRSAHISRVDEEEFEYLKSLKNNSSGARLFGKVDLYAKSSFEKDHIQPMKNFRILVEQTNDAGKKFEIFTDHFGKYELNGLPAGKYKVTPSIPENLTTSSFDEDVEFELNDKGCYKQNFRLENDSLVFVKVIDSAGNPVSMVQVELIPAEIDPKLVKPEDNYPEEFGVTNLQGGLYNFHVPPGRYTISVNYWNHPRKDYPFATTFYPGTSDRTKAEIVEVKRGTKIKDLVIQLPPKLNEKEIKGEVFWEDGTPANDVRTYIVEEMNENFCVKDCFYKTDSNGEFSVTGYESRKYRVKAKAEKTVDGEIQIFEASSEFFTLDENSPKIRLSLKKRATKQQ